LNPEQIQIYLDVPIATSHHSVGRLLHSSCLLLPCSTCETAIRQVA
jgi:hypothetical protein